MSVPESTEGSTQNELVRKFSFVDDENGCAQSSPANDRIQSPTPIVPLKRRLTAVDEGDDNGNDTNYTKAKPGGCGCPESPSASPSRPKAVQDDKHRSKVLMDAVQSLPAYIELSWMMLVLVPEGEHVDRQGELVNYCSWRKRGWCRLELFAAHLSRNDIRVMVVRCEDRPPTFVFSLDALHLPPGLGEFSCCAVDHDFGAGKIPCDKIAVQEVLTTLIEAKMAKLRDEGQWLELRWCASLQPWYCQGLDHEFCRRKVTRGWRKTTTKHGDIGRLAVLKASLAWRDEATEREFTRTTKTSLLFWAACANDLPSVRELLKDMSHETRSHINLGTANNLPEYGATKGLTPLMAAMMFSKWDVVNLLLNAGSDPLDRHAYGMDAFMVAAMFDRSDNIVNWLERLPQWDMERHDNFGLTALASCLCFGSNQLPTIQTLLEAGAKPPALILHQAANNPDASADLVHWILDYKSGVFKRKLHLQNQPRAKWAQFLYWTARVKVFFGSKVFYFALTPPFCRVHSFLLLVLSFL